jgi:hypothetical protein
MTLDAPDNVVLPFSFWLELPRTAPSKLLSTSTPEVIKRYGKKGEKKTRALHVCVSHPSPVAFHLLLPPRVPPPNPNSTSAPAAPPRHHTARGNRQPDAPPPAGPMELVPFKPAAGALVEAGGGADSSSIPAMVAAQQKMLHEQAEQLQNLLVTQCRITGVNPLAQEMVSTSCL